MHFSSDICGTLKHFKSLQQDWVGCGWGYLFPQVTSEQNLQELRLGTTVPPHFLLARGCSPLRTRPQFSQSTLRRQSTCFSEETCALDLWAEAFLCSFLIKGLPR